MAPSLTTQTSRLAGRLTPTILRGASTRVAHTGLEPSRDSPETLVLSTLTVPSELTDRGVPPLRLCPASSSGRGTCQTAWEAEELSPRATRVSRRSAITRRIIS